MVDRILDYDYNRLRKCLPLHQLKRFMLMVLQKYIPKRKPQDTGARFKTGDFVNIALEVEEVFSLHCHRGPATVYQISSTTHDYRDLTKRHEWRYALDDTSVGIYAYLAWEEQLELCKEPQPPSYSSFSEGSTAKIASSGCGGSRQKCPMDSGKDEGSLDNPPLIG